MVRKTIKRITLQNPVGLRFQQQFDASVAKIRNAVVPILGALKGKPVIVGSGVLLNLPGRAFFVTAGHVIESVPLFIFDANRELKPLEGEFFKEVNFDLAALPLTGVQQIDFSNNRFFTQADVRTAQPHSEQYATIVGYPSTKTRIMEGNFVDTKMYSMADFVREEKNGRLFVKFDKRRVTFEKPRRWITAPDPYGMSGGAIFSVPVLSIAPTFASGAKLAGIATHWRFQRKLFEGTTASTLLAFLKTIDAADSAAVMRNSP